MPKNLSVNSPGELRKLSLSMLPALCEEIRSYIVDHVASNGGHFSSSLGVVELTVALHYVFHTPSDKLVWDVGHQAYPHKLLTGRSKQFHSIRSLGGISGFPVMEESIFDAFGTGHSSTSLSAVLGMAMAARHRGEHKRQHIAVIGDGAMTAGMAFEALNNAGQQQPNMLVILNDNNMSIDANTGALQHYLVALAADKHYNALKARIRKLLSPQKGHAEPWSFQTLRKIEKIVKGGLLRYSNLFEALGIRYFGPVDGHDLHKLVPLLERLRQIPGPKLLHCLTEKGKGFAPAEKEKEQWHATGAFDKHTGIKLDTPIPASKALTFQQVFGDTMIELAHKNPCIMAVSPAMLSGSALTEMKRQMPDRVFDVGITEQHAVTFSAGLAADGMIPYCTIYSTFLQRAYDQLIHDVALQRLPVVFCIDRAGVVGPDGPTHQGAFDIAFLRCIPQITGAAPMDLDDFRNLLFTAQDNPATGTFAIRYPKGPGLGGPSSGPYQQLEIGRGRKKKSGHGIAILSLGQVGKYAIEACNELEKDRIQVAHYDLRFFKPLDELLLHEVFQEFHTVITVEDGCIKGGVGSAVMEFMVGRGYTSTLKCLGLPDTFAVQGSQQQLHKLYGYDQQAIVGLVREICARTNGSLPRDHGFYGSTYAHSDQQQKL